MKRGLPQWVGTATGISQDLVLAASSPFPLFSCHLSHFTFHISPFIFHFLLDSPQIGDLEEESSACLEEFLAVDIVCAVPLDFFIHRSISGVGNRPGHIGEGCEEISQELIPEPVILGDRPEEEITVELVRQARSTDMVLIHPFAV